MGDRLYISNVRYKYRAPSVQATTVRSILCGAGCEYGSVLRQHPDIQPSLPLRPCSRLDVSRPPRAASGWRSGGPTLWPDIRRRPLLFVLSQRHWRSPAAQCAGVAAVLFVSSKRLVPFVYLVNIILVLRKTFVHIVRLSLTPPMGLF